MFFRGPFLQFLRLDAEHGLDAILRLVNQATANWAAHRKGEVRTLVPWGEMEGWEGDVEVYTWYRQHLSGLSVMTSALMALEKWLYDLVDEGHDIGWVLARIFAESRSVAFAGVLVALGKRTPELFAGPLLPLLAAWPLYRWDRIAIENNEIICSDLSDFVDFGERVFEIARSWHNLPHRRHTLLSIAIDLLLKNQEVASAFEVFRERWREQLQAGSAELPEELEQMIAFFDPANYSSTDVTSFELPEPLREKNERERSAVGPDIEVASFTEWCRNALHEHEPLNPEESEALWEKLVELDQLTLEGEGFNRWTDALAVGIAALLDLGGDWIATEPVRLAWCRERLAAIRESPPTPDQESAFVAISGVLLLTLDGNDPLARRIVAEQIVGLWGNKVALILRYGFRERWRLGEDWKRIQTLSVLGAALRSVGQPAEEPAGDLLHTWASRLARWFVQRKIGPSAPSWGRISRTALRLRERLHQKEETTRTDEFAPQRFQPVSAVNPGFDLLALQAAFAWLPRLEEARDDDERHEWVRFHRELLGVAERIRHGLEQLGEEDEICETWGSGLLSEYERWLSPYLARLIPQLATAEERRSFWEPALRCFDRAETFVNAWFSEGLQAASTPESFVACWEEMVRFALSSPDLDLDTGYLLGMDWGATKIRAAEYRSVLRRLIPLFAQWTEQELRGARNGQRLARFLLRPAALDFICPGIRWLRRALPSLGSGSRNEEEEERLDQALVDVLRVGWTQFPEEIRADRALLDDFQDLLSWLSGRGGAAALDLQEEVRRSLLASR